MSTARPHGMQDSFFDHGIASFMSTVGAHGFQDSLFDCNLQDLMECQIPFSTVGLHHSTLQLHRSSHQSKSIVQSRSRRRQQNVQRGRKIVMESTSLMCLEVTLGCNGRVKQKTQMHWMKRRFQACVGCHQMFAQWWAPPWPRLVSLGQPNMSFHLRIHL